MFTPGPWEAYYVQSKGWSVRMAKPREGYDRPDPICSMAWWQFDKPGIIDDEISGSNARLIALAPTMFEFVENSDCGCSSNTECVRCRIIREVTNATI